MKPRVGQSFWSAFVCEGKIDLDEWIVTSARRVCRWKIDGRPELSRYRNTAYLTRKTPFTWVKRSRKHFDYGWAKSIGRKDRHELYYDDGWKLEVSKWEYVFSTKLRALLNEECRCRKELSGVFEDEYGDDGEVYTAEQQRCDMRRDLAVVRRAITMERRKRNAHSKNKESTSS